MLHKDQRVGSPGARGGISVRDTLREQLWAILVMRGPRFHPEWSTFGISYR